MGKSFVCGAINWTTRLTLIATFAGAAHSGPPDRLGFRPVDAIYNGINRAQEKPVDNEPLPRFMIFAYRI